MLTEENSFGKCYCGIVVVRDWEWTLGREVAGRGGGDGGGGC